jgi:hypothetical protein
MRRIAEEIEDAHLDGRAWVIRIVAVIGILALGWVMTGVRSHRMCRVLGYEHRACQVQPFTF